ncbi:hypothetical protein B0H66DRAFT_529490 [Apodospora peruviana]|uniref:C2H2-type domain-containing protein n=1 Tax=Apodospora peruviana TaxID=516989 RepID=A0AAE0II74_9PEZI|nr:hypothetical protein B0H66DRAFT_529490 [Apodospora peruviana]
MSQHLQYAHQEQCQPFGLPGQSTHSARPPRLPQSFITMDRPVAPVKTSSQVYEYASISPGSGTRETYGAFQPPGNYQNRHATVPDTRQYPQPQDPMERFMLGESSWDPLGGRQSGGLPFGFGIPDYTGYRNTTALSEVDTIGPGTLISDSGYGSMARQSVGNPSVYGDMDHNTDTQSLIQGVSDFKFHPGLSPDGLPPLEEELDRKSSFQHDDVANPDSNDLVCPECNSRVKTKSELNVLPENTSNATRNPIAAIWTNALGTGMDSAPSTILLDINRPFTSAPEPEKSIYGDSSETSPVQHEMAARQSSLSQTSWVGLDQPRATTVNSSHTSSGKLDVDQSSQIVQFSGGPLSIDDRDLSTHHDYSEDGYRSQISLDGPGHYEAIGPILLPSADLEQRPQEARDATPEEQVNNASPCINPDILNHVGLRASFSRDLSRVEDHRSEVFELESSTHSELSQEESQTAADMGKQSGAQPCDTAFQSFQLNLALKQDASVEQDALHLGTEVRESEDLSDTEQSSYQRKVSTDDLDAPKAIYSRSKPEPQSAPSTPESMSLDETEASAFVEKLMKKQALDEILQKLGYRMVKASDTEAQKTEHADSDSHAGKSGGQHTCPQCKKGFSRACELRKHMKRHDKPYACTYDQCDKRFGSKNDWKRHENSQHFQLECWKCNEKVKDSDHELCGKVCHRRETFTNHLEKEHNLGQKAIEGKWATCRVGRNCETRFWCGFCKMVVELEHRGGRAWTERFNHIDEHFNGRNGKAKMDISNWKSVESEPAPPRTFRGRSDLAEPANNGLRKRHRSRSEEDASSSTRNKRFKPGDGEVFWSCCSCETVWSPATTGNICMNCSHTHCDYCTEEAHKITENVPVISS